MRTRPPTSCSARRPPKPDATYADCGSDTGDRDRVYSSLANGPEYTIRVRTKNSNGNGPRATVTGTPELLYFGFLVGRNITLSTGSEYTFRFGANRLFDVTYAQPWIDFRYVSLGKPHKRETVRELLIVDRANS